MTTNAWGVAPAQPAAWADEVENEEQAHGQVLKPMKRDEDDFPSLAVTKNVKESKKDKKTKQQKMSLTDFMKAAGPSRPSDDEILMSLPTAPRARAPGEEPPARGLGGGFREYGGARGGSFRGRDDEDAPRRMREEDMGPSRAEMSDNWGKDRKFEPSAGGDRGFGGGFRDRDGGSFRDRERRGFDDHPRRDFDDGPSRADTTDNWGANRQFEPSGDSDRRGGGFGGDRYGPPREREFREPSKADTESRWERRGDFQPTAFEDRPGRYEDRDRPRGRGFGETWGSGRDGSRDAPYRESFRDGGSRDASQDRWRRGGDGPAPPAAGGSEGPRERPRLNLAPRSVPADKEGGAPAAAAPAAAKSNPFGAARPREEVLREQGRDYRKEELQLEHKAAAVLREETEEEAALAKEIEGLRFKVEAGEGDALVDPSEGAEGKTVSATLEMLELRLGKLQLELDDKVRYARQQRAESHDGPRRHEEGGRGFSQEQRGFEDRERRGFDDRDRRDERRGFDDRERREERGRDRYERSSSASYRDARPASGTRW